MFSSKSSGTIIIVMIIRDEITGDKAAIYNLTEAAFAPVKMSDGSEPQIVDDHRESGDLTLSLVVLNDDQIVGHIAFSPVTISCSKGKSFGLGPVSVHPEHQSAGIGRQLIEDGLGTLRSLYAAGCVLLGDPAYYGRFGFSSPGDLTFG
ncbi:GNAT family N-acetyltransferase [Sulfitobacter sp. MF3-043]|uniref:GNAT family N-acetyltransferase n=1 Tax=Sulfitobacter sediminivivens TaxID=3252902 RepID=UPI0036DA50FD